ncbi:hypothetical protein P5V15_011401 [Pogonomyrmex californicus]
MKNAGNVNEGLGRCLGCGGKEKTGGGTGIGKAKESTTKCARGRRRKKARNGWKNIWRKERWGGVKLKDEKVYTLAYADDLVLLTEEEEGMRAMMARLERYIKGMYSECRKVKDEIGGTERKGYGYLMWAVMYRMEIWGWRKREGIERMQEGYLRWMIGVGWKTPEYMLREELQRDN